MKRVVKYTAIDPYYSDQEITYIGESLDSLDSQEYETERHMGENHPMGINTIYKTTIVYETTLLEKEETGPVH